MRRRDRKMSDHTYIPLAGQIALMEEVEERSKLDTMLAEAGAYRTSDDYVELLEFVARMREFAPFNAMLLHIQKPGLGYAATAKDWRERFDRWPKRDARPLLILRPFGPVSLVYDVIDTEGRDLPVDVRSFVARGEMSRMNLVHFVDALAKSNIRCHWVDAGDRRAGFITRTETSQDGDNSHYAIGINQHHLPPVQFSTLAHELAHLALGHLGPDKQLKVPRRVVSTYSQREIEAESVAFLVCGRRGIEVRSKTYLSHFLMESNAAPPDVYQVMLAAGRVEQLLGIKPSEDTAADLPS